MPGQFYRLAQRSRKLDNSDFLSYSLLMEEPHRLFIENKTQVLDDFAQEKIVDQFVVGFRNRCKLVPKTEFKAKMYGYNSGELIDTFNYFNNCHLGNSIFVFWQKSFNKEEFSMNRLPLDIIQNGDKELARVCKILILIWYLILIQKVSGDFNPTIDSVIKNDTNKSNFGFSKKVFGNKMSVKIAGDDYSWQIKVEDFLNSKDRIRQLLKEYLFEQTNYCGKTCYITEAEMDLIRQHC